MTSVNGQPAVYVDGMWVVSQGGRKTWQSGTRSMLIFERDGVIFWITGDQRDGMTAYPLTQIASALTADDVGDATPQPADDALHWREPGREPAGSAGGEL